MAARKTVTTAAGTKTVEDKDERIELSAAVDPSLGDDDLWNDLVTENPVPDLVIKGIRIPQPTKKQIEEWGKLVSENAPDAEKALMSPEAYESLSHAFDNLPLSAWRNFQQKFTNHIFGLDDAESLGK
jgi:hypothetical protein